MEDLIFWALSLIVIAVGFGIGRVRERWHLADLSRREAMARDMHLDSFKTFPTTAAPVGQAPALVCGEAIIASDAFKTWASRLRDIFGGEVRNFTRLYMRARREATLRMLEEARAQGYNAVCNVRYGTADIGGNAVTAPKRNTPMASCVAYGTAYKRD